MSKLRFLIFALTLGTSACGGSASTHPSPTLIARLTAQGNAIALSVDGGDVYVILIDDLVVAQLKVLRVRGTEVTSMPANIADLSDYAKSGVIGLNPALTARVSGGTAYLMGGYGVTVVPLDGTPSTTWYPEVQSPGGLGAFTVDEGQVYVCGTDLGSNTLFLGRFDAGGAWQVLYTSDRPAQDESCFAGAITADSEAVYWSTGRAIRAYDKSTGAMRTVVDLGNDPFPPRPLVVSGGSLVWFDSDSAFHVADKETSTPATSAALGATTRLHIDPLSDPVPFSMIATSDRVYWLSPQALHRFPTGEGADDVLASRPLGSGIYWGLGTDEHLVYFLGVDLPDGGPGPLTLEGVAL